MTRRAFVAEPGRPERSARPAFLRLAWALAVGGGIAAPAQAQVPVEVRVTPPASGWTSPVAGETVTVRLTVGTGGAPVGVRFVGFKLLYRPEAYERVSQAVGPLLSGVDVDDSDGSADGFRIVRHDANVYGTARSAFSVSVALFDGAPLIQADGRIAFEAVLRVRGGVPLAQYEIVPGEVELRDADGDVVASPSSTARTASLTGGAGQNPAPLVVPEAGGFAVDVLALGASTAATVRRSEDPIAGTSLPAPYTAAAPGTWSVALAPATAMTADVCVPVSHAAPAPPNPEHLRLAYRASEAAPWTMLASRLVPDATSPTDVCAPVPAPGQIALGVLPANLPVELTAFSAVHDGAGVALRWTTASETNHAGFAVERQGSDSETWREIAFVAARGRGGDGAVYGHRIARLDPGTHRFRLRQMDLDGTATLSAETELAIAPEDLWLTTPAPNPVAGRARVAYGLRADGPVRLDLVDVTGRTVAVLDEGARAAGDHHATLDATTLPAGVYRLRLSSAAGVRTVPVLVLH